MWVGQQLADGLDFQGFVVSMIVGGVILSLYTGLFGLRGRGDGHEPRPSGPQGVWRQGFVSALGYDLVHADRLVRRGHRHVCHSGRQRAAGRQQDGGVGAGDRCRYLHDGLGLLRYQVAHDRQLYRRPDGGGTGYGRDGARRHARRRHDRRSVRQVQRHADGDRRRGTGRWLVRLRRHGDAELLPALPKAARWAPSQR